MEVPNQSGGGMGISRSTRLESFVRNDTVLWKSARSAVHHFLITSLLIGNDANRKAFASIYRYKICTKFIFLCVDLFVTNLLTILFTFFQQKLWSDDERIHHG